MNADKQVLYFIKDIEELLGRNRQSFRRWWEKGLFPQPMLICNRLAWKKEEIERWLNEQHSKNL